jgi:GNAT superfamily N-acetyltransferase
VLEFIKALAEYEHLLDKVAATEECLKKHLFIDKFAEVYICEYQEKPAGFVLFFYNYSTFLGKPGIYIEDLFVKPEFRGKGLGKKMLGFVARLAKERGCGKLEWACLDWNEPSIAFYKKQGAVHLSEWITFRLTDRALSDLADY